MVPTPWDAITRLLGNRNRHADPVVSKPANRPTVTRPVAHTPRTSWDPGPRDCPEAPAVTESATVSPICEPAAIGNAPPRGSTAEPSNTRRERLVERQVSA